MSFIVIVLFVLGLVLVVLAGRKTRQQRGAFEATLRETAASAQRGHVAAFGREDPHLHQTLSSLPPVRAPKQARGSR